MMVVRPDDHHNVKVLDFGVAKLCGDEELTRTGAVVGRAIAEQFEWEIGDRVPIQATIWPRQDGSRLWEFDIVGIYDGAEQATEMFGEQLGGTRLGGRGRIGYDDLGARSALGCQGEHGGTHAGDEGEGDDEKKRADEQPARGTHGGFFEPRKVSGRCWPAGGGPCP